MADRVNDTPPGFVKIPRALLREGWARNPQQLAVFLFLLLSANREAKTWNGIHVDRGQVITSIRTISTSCGLTIWAVREALKVLQREGAAHVSARKPAHVSGATAAHVSAHGYTIVTVCNFDNYEGAPVEVRTRSRTRENPETAHESARGPAITKEYINIIISILGNDFLPIVSDWITYKRERGESYKGKQGLTAFCNRLQKFSGGDPETARRIVGNSMANNYAGIFAEKTAAPPGGVRTSTPRPRINPRISIGETNPDDYTSTL